MSRYTGEIKGYPGNLNRNKFFDNWTKPNTERLKRLIDRESKHSPGWLHKEMDESDYSTPYLPPTRLEYNKRDYKADTGNFHGQPGVLHRFGRKFQNIYI